MSASPPVDRHRWAVEVLDPKRHDRVLEVGCGHGVTATLIIERLGDGRYTGIDRSEKMIAAASERNAVPVAAGRAAFVVGSFVDAPVPDHRVDAVVAFHVADFWNRPTPMLGRAADLLAADGRLLLLNQLPGWNQRHEPEAFADRLVAVLADHGWTVMDRIVATDQDPIGLAVAARPG